MTGHEIRSVVPAGHRSPAGRRPAVGAVHPAGRDLERAPGLPDDPAGHRRRRSAPDRLRVAGPGGRDPEPAVPPWEQDDGAGAEGRRSDAVPGERRPTRVHGRWRIAGRVVVAMLAVLCRRCPGLAPTVHCWAGCARRAAQRCSCHRRGQPDNDRDRSRPPRRQPSVGLVFSPGAQGRRPRRTRRCCGPRRRPVTSSSSSRNPSGWRSPRSGQSAGPIADHPEISRWAVGGHSLGGVSAASFAADHLDTVDGLLLWASYPNQDMSADVSLQVESIYGSNDLLATPADIDLSRSLLPPNTTFTRDRGWGPRVLRRLRRTAR